MANECPQCGQRLRPQWVRCPRCRALLPAAASASADANSRAKSSAGNWQSNVLLILGAVVAIGIVALIVSRDAPSTTVNAAPPAAERRTRQAPELSEPEATEVAATPTTTFEAIDSKRSAGAAYKQGNITQALADLEAAVAAAPNDPEARNNLGQLLIRNGRAAESLPHFDEAIRLVSNRWEYRFNRARAYGLVNRWNEAVAEYRAAAQLFPEDYATLYNLGLAQLRVRDYQGAVTSLEQAVTAAPEQHDFLISLGTAYVGVEQPERARATFEKFLAAAPDDADAPKVKALLQALAESAP